VSSVSPSWDQSNAAVIALLWDWLADLGFRTITQEIPGYPGKLNLIATLGEGSDGLVLAGHTDTVPYDAGRWNSDPFILSEADQRLYGLGTADMKGFFALAIEAVRELRARDLRRPLTILATADEESRMTGVNALVESGVYLGRHALIGEPTGLRPVRLHKGVLMETIRLTGRSAHSSDPSLGNSALEGMYRVLGAILRWREELQTRYRNPLFQVAVPTLNLGHIHGGDNPNRICGECELQIDLRPLPGMDPEALRTELRRVLDAELADSGLQLSLSPLVDWVPPMETLADAAIVRVAEQLTGQPAGAVAFATEGPFLNQMGLETVILGPGDIEQAHQPDEYLRLDRITPTIHLLQGLVQRFCGLGS
jgi:acetylornithine deacetylase